MKRSLLGSIGRTLFSRAYLTAYPMGRTFGPSAGQSRSQPQKLILNDLTVGAYYKFTSDSYKSDVLQYSNHLYLHSVNIQEHFEIHKQKKQASSKIPLMGFIGDTRLSNMFTKLQKQVDKFQKELDELIYQISTIAKVTFSNKEQSNLPVACATNVLYLLGLKNSVDLKDQENLNVTYSFCFKLLEEKLENIHLEGIAQAIWGLAKLLERGGEVADLLNGPNGQRIVDKLMKSLEGRAFGDEIRYVDKVGMDLDQYAATSEYLSNRGDGAVNFLNENWAAFILIEGLCELKEKRGFKIETSLIEQLRAKRGALTHDTIAMLRSSQTHLIPRELQALQISQS